MLSFVEFKKEDIEQSIPSRFEEMRARHASRLAVKDRQRAFTYDSLNAFANRVAQAILAMDDSRDTAAVVLMKQGAPLLGAILGVLKSGHFYVPLDTTFPEARLQTTIKDCEARVIIAEEGSAALAAGLAGSGCRVLNIDDLPATASAENPLLSVRPDSLAYVYYTSGSTGKPKGVMDTHRNVLHNVMRYTNNLRIAPTDRLTLLQTPSFSGAVSSMFCAVLNGAASFPFDLRTEGSARLAAWLREERITIYHSVPMIFRSFLTGREQFPDVRVIRLEGDASSKTDVELFKRHFLPPCILANGLGATETGLSCQYRMTHDTELEGGIVPIGHPTTDMEVVLLDAEGTGIGEIAVRSEFLAPGYWKQPELTAKAFVDGVDGRRTYRTGDMGRCRTDGCIEYLGRKDFQLKVRGNRVEPAEVESALLMLDNVKEAVVTTRADARGEARLIGYVVPSRKPLPSIPDLRRALASKLPDYMVPTVFVFLDALPLNVNRKVDRRSLPAPSETRSERTTPLVPARDEIERLLVATWEEELSIRPLGITDHFLDWGGDSLAAMHLLVSIEKTFGRSLPMCALVEAPTVEELACVIRMQRASETDSTLVPIQPRGAKPPLFCVHDQTGEVFRFVGLSRRLGDEQPLYGVKSVGLSDSAPPLTTIEAMAARYLDDIRAVQPRGPYHLTGFCYGAVVAFEMAHQLHARGEEVALLALLSVSPFDFRSLMTYRTWLRYRRHCQTSTLFERIALHLAEAGDLPLPGAIGHVVAKASLIPSFLARGLRRRVSRSRRSRVPDATPAPAPPTAVTLANREAFARYRPRPLSSRVVVFLDEPMQQACTPEPVAEHRGLTTGELVVHIIPGAVHTMTHEPGVRDLAKLLRGYLA